MRKAMLALLASGLFMVGVPALAAGAPRHPRPVPACADIVEGGGVYHDPAAVTPDPGDTKDPEYPLPEDNVSVPPPVIAPGSFSPELRLAGKGCSGMTYTIHVLDDDGVTPLASQSVRGSRGSVVVFDEMIIVDDDPGICVYATSSAGSRLFDRVPAVGCTVSMIPDRIEGIDYWWFP